MNQSDRSVLRQHWSPRSPTGVSTSGLRKEVMLPMHMDAVEMNKVWGRSGILPPMATACAECSGKESLQGGLCCCLASWCELDGCCWATWAALAAMPVTSSFYNICILACLSCSPGFSAVLPWKHNLPGCCSATGECGELAGAWWHVPRWLQRWFTSGAQLCCRAAVPLEGAPQPAGQGLTAPTCSQQSPWPGRWVPIKPL